MKESRLTKQIFIWDYTGVLQGKKGWNREIKTTLEEADMSDTFYGLNVENIKDTIKQLQEYTNTSESQKLLKEISDMPKLRSYQKLKINTGTENYITYNIKRYHRSLLAKIRIGILPINIELGRYKRTPVENRTCPRCQENIEDEMHFLIKCPLYKELRQKLFETLETKINTTATDLPDEDLFYVLLNVDKMMKPTAQYIESALKSRNSYILATS